MRALQVQQYILQNEKASLATRHQKELIRLNKAMKKISADAQRKKEQIAKMQKEHNRDRDMMQNEIQTLHTKVHQAESYQAEMKVFLFFKHYTPLQLSLNS